MVGLLPQELEVLKEVPAASQSTSQEVEMLQTQPSYHTGGSKCTFGKVVFSLLFTSQKSSFRVGLVRVG